MRRRRRVALPDSSLRDYVGYRIDIGDRVFAQRVHFDIFSVDVACDDLHGRCRELILIKIRVKSTERQAVISLAEIFKTKIVDVTNDSMMIELIGSQSKLEAFLELLEGYEILELARTGITGLTRGSSDVKMFD